MYLALIATLTQSGPSFHPLDGPPTPSATPTPPPNIDPNFALNIANLAMQICIGILAFLTLVLALMAIFGFRSLTEVRRIGKTLQKELSETRETRKKLTKKLADLQNEFESLVQVAHLFHEGQTAYAQADYDRAVVFFEDALAIQPDNNKIKIRLARTYINQGLNASAENLLRSASKDDPDNSDAWRALATEYRYTDPGKALQYIQAAIDLNSKSHDNFNYHGLLLRDAKRYPEALAAHREALRLASDDAIACFHIALLEAKLNHNHPQATMEHAYHRTEALRKTQRIKRIWADIIEWAYLSSVGENAKAVKVAQKLSAECTAVRNRQAIVQHMVFYLDARGVNLATDVSLQYFEDALVQEIINTA